MIILLPTLLILLPSACGQKAAPQPISEALPDQTRPPVQKEEKSADSNILIAYFSAPEDVDTSGVDAVASASIVVSDGQKLGSTEYVAGLIQQTVGGKMFRIETVEDYPNDHDPLVDQAAEEQDTAARPELKTQVENFDQYETMMHFTPEICRQPFTAMAPATLSMSNSLPMRMQWSRRGCR